MKSFYNKRGLSGIITMVLLIAMVMVASFIVWGVVKSLAEDKLESAKSCFGIFEKVSVGNEYTCYDSDSDEFRFSINVGDIEIDELLVSVTGQGTSKSYTITNNEQLISGLSNYPSGSTNVKLPAKNAGLTYIESGRTLSPDSIRIAPVVDGKQCEESDSLYEIDDCNLLAS